MIKNYSKINTNQVRTAYKSQIKIKKTKRNKNALPFGVELCCFEKKSTSLANIVFFEKK